MELKIGILLPRSDMYPTLGMDFLNGLKLSLETSIPEGVTPKYIVESVGSAADETLLKIAEKMLLQEGVNFTVSFCSVFKLEELTVIFNNYKKPLIHVDLGGNVLKPEHFGPYVLHHTLNLWQSGYAAGKYAAEKFGKKGFMASSIYEGGYHLPEAFNRGYSDAGGFISNYYVSPMDYKSETYEPMLAGISEEPYDVVFALFSFKEGKKVFDILAKSDLNGTVPIMAIPMMTDEIYITENLNIEGVQSVASWAFDDDTPQMKNFLTSYQQNYDDSPNIMGLLGYEVGITVGNCITSEGKVASKLADTLQQKTLETPRGTLRYNSYNESQVDTFKLRKFEFNKTKYHNTVIDTVDTSFSETMNSDLENLPYNGWQNPYICT